MPKRFATYNALLSHLDALGLFHMDLSLDRMERFFERTGLSRPPFHALHVVGTNGKGSTCAFLDALLRAHGIETGLYASPHFCDVRERVKRGGRPLPEDAFLAAANRIAEPAGELGLTYFEFLTALALSAFAAAPATPDDPGSGPVRAAVLEAGLGGRFDAVTALSRDLLVFTSIGLDHMRVLGPDIASIARDKAGAMRPGLPVLCARQEPEAMRELENQARLLGCPLEVVEPLPPGTPLGLDGPHQRQNAALALAAFRRAVGPLGLSPDPEAEARALATAFLPGRMQRVPAGEGHAALILDGAHNAPGLAALGAALEESGQRPGAVVFVCFADKDVQSLAPLVLALTDGPVVVPRLDVSGRESDHAAVARIIGPRAVAAPSLDTALALTAGCELVLVCGSLYLLGEFFTKHPRLLLPPHD